MDQNKKCKFGTYYSELIKKYGLVLPALCALAAFAVIFYVRFVGMFDALKAHSELSMWLTIGGALLGIVLIIAFILTKIKNKEVGAADILLLTLLFLLVYVLLGIVVFDFLSINTVYFAVALVLTVALTVVRILLSDPQPTVVERVTPNINFKKYFGTAIGKYGFWTLFLPALGILGALLVSNIWSFPQLFLSNKNYLIGLLIVGAITVVALVVGIIGRIKSCRINNVDAFMMTLFFTAILSVVLILISFSVLGLILWFVGLCVIVTLLRVLAAYTRVDEETTDDSFFATDANKKFVKNPKIYFKNLVTEYNMIVLCAIASMIFAVLNALVATDFFGWANANSFMVFTVIALCVYFIYGLAYFATKLKNKNIGRNDAALIIFDIALLLLAISIFTNLNMEGILASIILWAVSFALCVAFTIVRMFKVREEVVGDEQAVEEVEEAKKNQ